MNHRIGTILALAAGLGLGGCLAEDLDLELGSSEQAVKSQNLLSGNLLSNNLLSNNLLSGNLLSHNLLSSNLLSSNILSFNSLATNGEEESENGRLLLKYLVRCAMPATTQVAHRDAAGQEYTFEGLFGLAPEWANGALSAAGRSWVSACLMAHTNAHGVSVPISVRADGVVPTSWQEKTDYSRQEATFFGDVFDPDGGKYVCWDGSRPDWTKPAYKNVAVGDRILRVCSDPGNPLHDLTRDGAAQTMCGFTLVGRCKDVCRGRGDDDEGSSSYSSCYTNKYRTGRRYSEIMTVWLLGKDHPGAVWTKKIDAVYGAGSLAASAPYLNSYVSPSRSYDD